MANNDAKSLAKKVAKIVSSSKRTTEPFDTPAKVKRVEGDIVYVHIPGGVDETPVEKTVNANKGDTVQVRVSNGRAFLVGNVSNPPTDDTVANVAKTEASRATTVAEDARIIADNAEAEANRAGAAADRAEEKADIAAAAADRAGVAADRAETEARNATRYANNALAGLSTLESVVDTVNWFAAHKTASTDIVVNPNKTYYIFNEQTGTLSEAQPEGTENPSEEGWFELDEAISNYVASHVAQTDDGLYVVNLTDEWKILVSSGAGNYAAGVYIIDPTGGIAQAMTANGITFDENKPFYIGDDNAYIIFDGNGGIRLGGNGVTLGSNKPLNTVLQELGASIKSVEYGVGSSPTSHSDISNWSPNTPVWTPGTYIWMRTTTNGLQYTYTCIQGAKGEDGEDAVNMSILSTEGTVFKSNTASTRLDVYLYHGGTEITTKAVLEQHFGAGTYLQWEVRKYGDPTPTTIPSTYPYLSNDGFSLTVNAEDVNTWTVYNVKIITP